MHEVLLTRLRQENRAAAQGDRQVDRKSIRAAIPLLSQKPKSSERNACGTKAAAADAAQLLTAYCCVRVGGRSDPSLG